jgi:hypothetical protein
MKPDSISAWNRQKKVGSHDRAHRSCQSSPDWSLREDASAFDRLTRTLASTGTRRRVCGLFAALAGGMSCRR